MHNLQLQAFVWYYNLKQGWKKGTHAKLDTEKIFDGTGKNFMGLNVFLDNTYRQTNWNFQLHCTNNLYNVTNYLK